MERSHHFFFSQILLGSRYSAEGKEWNGKAFPLTKRNRNSDQRYLLRNTCYLPTDRDEKQGSILSLLLQVILSRVSEPIIANSELGFGHPEMRVMLLTLVSSV